MADDVERPGESPVHEHEVKPHLPAPTIWPAGFAAGVALVLIGLVVSWPVVAVGVVVVVVFGFLWVRGVTRDVRGPVSEPEPPPEVHELVGPVATEEEPTYTRSRFLEGSTLGLGALIGGVVTVPVVGFAVAPAFVGQDYEDIDLGSLENFPQGEWIVATFVSKKREGDVSTRTVFVRSNGFVNDAPSFTIISNRCTHMGCPTQPGGLLQEPSTIDTESGPVILTPSQSLSGFACPCHASAFDIEGNRTAGPAVRALDRYRFKIVNGRLVLSDPYSVGKVIGEGAEAKIEAYGIADPGQHVDGFEQYFYPYVP